MKSLGSSVATFVVLATLATVCKADNGPYQEMLRRLPDSTNVLVTADVTGLRQALGVAPGTALMAADISGMPIAASKFVMGAHMDMSERRHLWSMAMCQHGGKMAIQDIAKAEGEAVEQVAGYNVVPSLRNAYFIELGKDMLGAGSPANRQQLKRWLTFQKTNQLAAISPYLLQAASSSDSALITMAVDLADSLDPAAIHRGLNGSQVLAARQKPNYEAVGKTLQQVKGLTFTITPGSPLTGDLVVDFDTDTAAIRSLPRPCCSRSCSTRESMSVTSTTGSRA